MSNKHPNNYFHSAIDENFIGMMDNVSIGQNKSHFLGVFNQRFDKNWKNVLEIRASGTRNSEHDTIINDCKGLTYIHTDVLENPNLKTIKWDFISKSPFEDNSIDVVFSNQSLEHTRKPWIICEEITRILKPGGLVYVRVPWAWRYHPAPIDYWRFSPECLIDLFSGLKLIECKFDSYFRRKDIRGLWDNKKDEVPIDSLGGWIENWQVYYIGTKE